MFKNILPNEANLQQTSYHTRHLRNSAYSPLATALLSGAARIRTSLRRLSKAKH